MAAELTYIPEVEGDLDEAFAWYEGRQRGLGEEMLRRVDDCIRAIRNFPEMRPPLYKHYRKGLVRKFPYAVHYGYRDGRVTIYGVLHTASDPDKWLQRVP